MLFLFQYNGEIISHRKVKFSSDTLTDPNVDLWLLSVPDNVYVKCKLCKKKFSNVDRRSLISHTSGQKISKIANAVSVFIKSAKMFKTLQMKCKLCKKTFIIFNLGRRN